MGGKGKDKKKEEPKGKGKDAKGNNGTQLKVYAWYDNEMAYACRMVDLACHMESVGV